MTLQTTLEVCLKAAPENPPVLLRRAESLVVPISSSYFTAYGMEEL